MPTKPVAMSDILDRLDRIEQQLAFLIKTLADDNDEQSQLTLDGFDTGRERDANQPL